jgi:hypothetical protein
MKKKVSITAPGASHQPEEAGNHRKWLKKAPPRPEMKRFTIDVPVELHRQVKAHCSDLDVPMADLVRALLERELEEKTIA